MSADINDVARIQDEDVLRRMWQDTDDFGRKKEIRSHMYKLREARLKDFYNSADLNSEIRRSSTTSTSTIESTSKSNMSTTHADSLADQSYVTLKSKEVRDSESPTRDTFNRSIVKHQDKGWTINTSNERSVDGKAHTSTHTATTSGTQQIDGGKLDYAAKLEDKTSVFQDGDDRNFTRAVGNSTSSVIRQDATGGDENSNFRSSSTKTTSSSRYVSESKSTNEDIQMLPSSTTITREQVPYSTINEDNAKSVVQKTYTTNVPSELKNHPTYVEGKTKVTQETKTLADGTIVTTTRYETKRGNSTETATHKKYSNIASSHLEQKSSASSIREESNRNVVSDTRHTSKNNQGVIEYVVEPRSSTDINFQKTNEHYDRHSQESRDINRNETISSRQSTKVVRESTQNQQIDREDDIGVRKNRRTVQDKVEYVEIPLEIPINQNITTRTSTTKTVVTQTPQDATDTQQSQKIVRETIEKVDSPVDRTVTTKTTTTKTTLSDKVPQEQTNTTYLTTSTHVVNNQKHDTKDVKSTVNDQFISTERQHEVNTRESVRDTTRPSKEKPLEEPYRQPEPERYPGTPQESHIQPDRKQPSTEGQYIQPDRRQPIKPGVSEFDQKLERTKDQYDTTYRTDYTSKKISVEVSATHDAFARSLRSITPERITKGTPKSGSNTSLRSTGSPDKMRYPLRSSPDRQGRSRSPKKSADKYSSTETVTYTTNRPSPTRKSPDKYPGDTKMVNGHITVNKTTETNHYNTDTITRKSKTSKNEAVIDTIDSSTLTRRKNRPRSPSPTETTSTDFEYMKSTKDITTDLDEDYTQKNVTRKVTETKDVRPSSLEITTRKVKKVTERSPTSPLTDLSSPRRSPVKEPTKKDKSPTKDSTPTFERPKLIRTDTYEERVKELLGLSKETSETRRSSLERNSLKRSSLKETSTRITTSDNSVNKISKTTTNEDSRRKSPEKQFPERRSPVKELPSPIRKSPEKPQQIRKSPEKNYTEKKSPTKYTQSVSEFPAQTRKSLEKEPLQPYPEKKSPTKHTPSVSEFPSQVRKSPERERLEPYPQKKSPTKYTPSVAEFPSQIRRSPEREPLEPYPEKKSPTKYAPSVSEFPAQSRKSPEKESLEPYPEKKSPTKHAPSVAEFPSQIRRSPEKEPLEPYPEKKSSTRYAPSVSEFPAQARRSPEKEPLEPYPEKKSPTKHAPSVAEFPSQIRRSPEREPLEPYPEKKSPTKYAPSVSEFPAQIRKSPEKEPLEPYPEKKSPSKHAPSVSEFPSQIRRSPEKEPLGPYPEKKSPTKYAPSVSEFPAQTRKSPEKEPLEPYPEKKSPTKYTPSVAEFPSQIRRSPEREPLEPYPEKKSPTKYTPSISEFPAQTRKSPEKEPLEPYPEKNSPTKHVPSVSEFPSQIRRSPEKEPLEPYPEKKSPVKYPSSVSEFPSQIRRSPEREPMEPYQERPSPTQYISSVSEFPSQVRKSPEREPLEPYPEKSTPTKHTSSVPEVPSQIKKSPEKHQATKKSPELKQPKSYPDHKSPTKKTSGLPSPSKKVPSQRTPEKQPHLSRLEKQPEKKVSPQMSEYPSQLRKSPGKHPIETGQNTKVPTTKPLKEPKRTKTTSESSSTSEEDIEERVTEKVISQEGSQIPVSEPIVEKKLFSQLCRENEFTRIDKKKTTQELIETEIQENELNAQQTRREITKGKQVPDKHTPTAKRTTKVVTSTIELAKTKTNSAIPKDKSPVKKVTDKTPPIKMIETKTTTNTRILKKDSPKTKLPTTKKQSETIYRVEKTRFVGATEYQDEYSKISKLRKEPVRKPQKSEGKITLHDIEVTDNIKEDKSTHIRTNRVDDTVTRKKVTKTILVNGDVNKPKPKSLPVKTTSPTKKTPVSVTSISKPADKINEVKPKHTTTSQTRYSTTVRKTVNEVKTKNNKIPEPKKHVVTSTITVVPKTKPVTKTTGSKTVEINKKTIVSKKATPSKLPDHYDSSDTDEDSTTESVEGSFIDLSEKRDQSFDNPKEPEKEFSKPDLYFVKDGRTRKVITTKTVIINNEDIADREVIVNLQRSKSSREPTPDRLCPRPLTSDEEEDFSPARYPDQISEPEDTSCKRKPTKLSDLPILESEDTSDNARITEMTDVKCKITEVDKVEETDESLLSIDKKINKFLNTADQLTKKPFKPKPGKADRPTLEVSEDLKEDECLLSVSDKVSKFITTAEQLTTSNVTERSKSYNEKPNVNIQKKVTEYQTSVEDSIRPKQIEKEPTSKLSRPSLDDVENELSNDECLLSVSDKVNKFISTAEKLTSTNKPVSLSKIDVDHIPKVDRQSPSRDDLFKPDRRSPVKNITNDFIHTETKHEISTRKSPSVSPERRRSPEKKSPEEVSPQSILKSTRRDSQEESKLSVNSTTRLRSNESIKKAKALFENIGKDHDTPWQKDILKRPSVFDKKLPQTETTSREESSTETNTDKKTESTRTIETVTRRASSPQKSSDRAKSPQKDRTTLVETVYRRSQSPQKSPDRATSPQKTEKTTSVEAVQRRSQSPQKSPDRATSPQKTEKTTPVETVQRRSQSPQKSPENAKYTTHKIESTTLVETLSKRSESPQKFSRSQSPQKSPERVKSPEKTRAGSPQKVPEIVAPATETVYIKTRSREGTPDGDLPHYMKPLDRSLRPNSPHRDSINQAKPQQPQTPVDQVDTRQTKFGVTLRRTDSGRTSKTFESSTTTTERRKSSITMEKRVTEEEIEEIFDLQILEELLEKVVGYELRRKIRAQIRLVKKLISEGTLEVYISSRKTVPREAITRRGSSPSKTGRPDGGKKASPERKVVENKSSGQIETVNRRSSTVHSSEYHSSYSHSERRSSEDYSKTTRISSVSPARDRISPQRFSPDRISKPTDVRNERTTIDKKVDNIPGGTRTTTTTTTERTFTTLKKTVPPTKKPTDDTQPEWVRQRNLRNAKESAAPTGKKVSSTTTTSSTTRKSTLRTSPAKEVKGTDIITSSYGVGPTDENGAPLFGLKALRAQNKNEKVKVQGTVIRSEYYSENDQEPVGQVSVTKYSTDPRDLEQDGGVSTNGAITSVTTTQKFGYQDTPSLQSLTDKKREICDINEKSKTKTTKVNRRGSVKEISKKFIDNAVESLKSERQTTYPKAGLILRSSSFKSTNGEGEPDSREPSPADDRQTETTVSVRTMRTSASGETFLSNKNKISGVQDVITRMKTEEYEEGDTAEDIAARGLLNKFIGSQVILSGMEAHAASSTSQTTSSTSPGGTVRRTTKITTTVTEGGKPTTSTRVFQRPVTEKELETVWDEQSLRLLLEQSTDYEERRIVRIRLRQVMAEQEVCTALVDEATRGEDPKTPTTPTTPGQFEGESQLLPLLQGLLDAPENDVTPDSGTESGEDQRSSLIAEVQTALEKLSNSLKSDQTDITPERRSSLLQLVTKLQAGLSGGTGNERRASTVSSSGRFQKRKNKQARHTVGVSKEELADARRLIEQISLNELTPSSSTNKLQLSKQSSESSVPTSSASSSYHNVHHKVKNATAKPFSSSNSTTSSVQTPTDHFEGFEALFNDDKDITANETAADSNASIKSAYKAVQQAAQSKVAALKREQSREPSEKDPESEEEDESSTLKGASDLENASLKNNPIYSKPSDSTTTYQERSNRFDTQKKLRMKRANTIDIPKALIFYEDEDETESEHEDEAQKRRESYYALRGPINVSNPHTKKIVPTFEPKTDSDKKFLAFIKKHNENDGNKGSMWAGNSSVWSNRFGNIKNTFENNSIHDAKNFWKSADDSIKKSSSNQFGPKISRRSARNLQQMFEEKQKESQKSIPKHVMPVSVPNHNISPHQQQNVVTGKLQVKTEPERHYRIIPQPLPVNQFSHAPQSAFRPIKKPSESPTKRTSLVFSPSGGEILKSEIKENDGSSFLYSPKPISRTGDSPTTVTSPGTTKPWAASVGGSRVLSLAASKFEQPPQEPLKPRKSISRAFGGHNFTKSNIPERTQSYTAKGSDSVSNSVRKLSGQYENFDSRAAEYQPKQQTYQVKTSVVESQYTPPVKQYEQTVKAPVQTSPMFPSGNYNIVYGQPQNYSIKYDQKHKNYGNQQFQQPQNYSIRYDQPQNPTVIPNKSYQQQSVPQNYSIRDEQPRSHQLQMQPTKSAPGYQQQNYSSRYSQPQPNRTSQNCADKHEPSISKITQPQESQNYSISSEHHQPNTLHQIYQHIPGREKFQSPPHHKTQKHDTPAKHDAQYTSNCEFKPNQTKVPVQIIEPVVQPPKAERQISEESVHEHNAVSSRVMSGPVSQQAVTVRQKSPMSRDQHDMQAAFSLKNSLYKISKQEQSKEAISPAASPARSPTRSPARSPSNSFSYKPKEPEMSNSSRSQSFKYQSHTDNTVHVKYKPSDCPKPTVSPSSFKFKNTFEEVPRETRNCGVVKPIQQQKPTPIYNNVSQSKNKEVNQHRPSVVTGQFHIPVINVKSPESPRVPNQASSLSKSDSWHEICMAHQNTSQKPVPKPGPVKSKSSHSLAVPKMFEAGMSKDEMAHKRRTMEAFLLGNKSPSNEVGGKTVKRSINRVKTSQKVSTQSRSSGGICRSRTLPDMMCPNLLDESNVDKAFDELFESS